MRILFDNQGFDLQLFGGVSNCFTQLLKHLPPNNFSLGVIKTRNEHLLESGLVTRSDSALIKWLLNNQYFRRVFLSFEYRFRCISQQPEYLNKRLTRKLINEGDYDLLHCTYFDTSMLKYNNKPYVMTIHDMTPELYNIDPKQVKNKLEMANNAAHIIAVSQNTKNDIMRLMHIPESKISVVYHGYNKEMITEASRPFDKPYILYVGTRKPVYKNFWYFVEETTKFLTKHKEFIVVCTGQKFNEQETKKLEEYGVSNRFVSKFCTTKELNQLYANAFAFVYPSLYEGFGMPILEAYNANCPVILNRKSCFPEIAQDAALYFDSDCQEDSLLDQLEILYTMEENDRNELLGRQKKRLEFFSWDKAASDLLNVYTKVLENVNKGIVSTTDSLLNRTL